MKYAPFLSNVYWNKAEVDADIERLIPMAIARKDLPCFQSISSRLTTIKLNRGTGKLEIHVHNVPYVFGIVETN